MKTFALALLVAVASGAAVSIDSRITDTRITDIVCPMVACAPPQDGCRYEGNKQLNSNGCPKYPCGVLTCTSPTCPNDCTQWFDGCNTCTCSNGVVGACTRKACAVMQRPKCLDRVPCSRDGSNYCKAPTQWDADVCKCTSECDGTTDIPQICTDKPIDIAFVLDSSGSIGTNWGPLVTAVGNIITGLKIGPNDIQVAAHIFSRDSDGNPGFGLDEHTGWVAVKNAINGFTHLRGSTYIGQAVKHTVDEELVASEGLRDTGNAPAMIIVTDGQPSPTSQGPIAVQAANAAKAKGIKVFAIGVGGYNGSNLNAMASGEDYVFKLAGFDVDAFKSKLLTEICTGSQTTAQVAALRRASSGGASGRENLL